MSDIPAEELKRRMREALEAADTEGVPDSDVPDWAREDPAWDAERRQRPSGRGLTREDTQVMELPVTPNPRGTFAERRAFADARVAETEDEMRAEELYEAEQARLRAEEDHDVEMETASPDIVAGRSLPAGMATVKGGDLPKPVTTEEDRAEFIGSMMAPPVDTEGLDRGLERTADEVTGDLEPLTGPNPEAGGAMWDEIPPADPNGLDPEAYAELMAMPGSLGDHEATETPAYEATEPASEEASEGEEPHRSLDIDWGDMPALLASAEDTSSQDQGDALGDMSGRAGTIDNSRWMSEPGEEQSQLDDLGREDLARRGVPSLGEGFDDPDYSSTLPAEATASPTEMDAMAMGLEGRVFEDGSIAGANGFPGISNPDDDAGPWESAEMTSGSVEPGGMDLADPRGVTGKTPDPGDPLARLDAGLPSEGDIEGAQAGDVVRRILHALGSAFRAGGGGTPTPFRSNAEELAEERRAGIRDRLDTKADFADTRARTESAERIAEGENATDLRLDESTTRRAGMRAETAADATDVRRMEAETRRSVADREAAREAALTDPGSEVSRQRRIMAEAALAGAPARLREAVTEGLDMNNLSASDLDALLTHVERLGRPDLSRRAGGGGGGGGAAAAPGSPRYEAQVEEIMRLMGVDRPDAERIHRANVAGTNVDDFRTLTGALARSAPDMEVIEGVMTTVRASPAERRAIRDDLLTAMTASDATNRIRELVDEAGGVAGAAANPEIYNDIHMLLNPILAYQADEAGMGILQPSEVERLASAIPDPRGGATGWMSFNRVLNETMRIINARVSRGLSIRGASPEDIERVSAGVRSGWIMPEGAERGDAGAAGPADADPEIVVRGPDGRTRRVRRSEYNALPERVRAALEVSP